ncbi:uncharacterized protein PRCAT00000895001 [Priceomyces carsonii]|uniref:uncharacterized protein n=1 Tax=Priceomyces carsonii TaxID=28549 RepID=UPI002EDADDC4|nr:unnamed protein product [Priceomyces carsonii]
MIRLTQKQLNYPLKCLSSRSFSYSSRNTFFSNFFGSKEIKKNQDIIKNQDDYEVDPKSKIVILDEKNSSEYKPFDAEIDMPGFEVRQWKFQTVKDKDIESTFTPEILSTIINETFQEIKGIKISEEDYVATDLHDLQFRFKFAKLLQQKLGFNINDYTLSTSHSLSQLSNELGKVISTRWATERNPNAIVLRKEDFQAPNVYLNTERNEKQQEKLYSELVQRARESGTKPEAL